MMTNLLNGAHVANKLFSTIARLRLLLVMFLTLTVSAEVWGDTTVNIAASDLEGMGSNQYAAGTKTVGLFTISADGCYGTTQFRITQNKTITISCSEDYAMTKIVFTTASGYSIAASNLSSQTWSAVNGQNSVSFKHTNTKGARITNIAITYSSVGQSYAITAQSNDIDYGTVSLSGTTITASPNDCYQVSSYEVTKGTADVSQNGNTFNVSPSSDCTIQINFEAKPVNIYIDNIHGNAQQEICDSHKTPTLLDKTPATTGTCEQQHWHFMGWVTEANKENPTDDNIVKSNTSVTANGATYYAVWAIGTTTGGGSTSKQYSFDITKGDFNTTSYVANNNSKTSTAKASDNSTKSVSWTSNQVMQQSSTMQWQSSKGYIYNTTDLGNITNITITSTAGTFTTYYGTSQQPSQKTSVGTGNGYFQIKVGSATGKVSNIKVTFTQTVKGETTTTYSDYITTCTTEPSTSTYTVKHCKEGLEAGSYPDDLIETETLEGTIGEQVTPGRKNYTGFTAPSGKQVTIQKDGVLVVTYQYTRNSYTLTWELGDGIVTTEGTAAEVGATGTISQEVRYGTPITAPIVQREGYRFNKWNTSVSNTMPASDKSFTATWVKTWDIIWKAQGNTIQTVTVDADSKLTLPTEEVATCEGMTHIGWTANENYASDTDAPDDFFTYAIGTVSENKIYHAVYALSCGYTKLDWGSEVPEGKYLISTGTNTIYGQNGTTKTYLGATAYAPTRELKPEYEVCIRKVGTAFAIQLLNTMWVGLASSSSTNTNLTIDPPETDAAYTWKYTKNGIQNQSAESRYLQINGAGSEGRVYTTTGSGSTWHPTYLYARNNGGYYTTCQTSVAIDYDLNGGTGNMSNTRVKSGSDYIIPTAVPTQVGKTFTHWSDGTNTYAAGATINNLTNDITLTAQWKVAQHTVTLNPNYPAGKTGTFTDKDGNTINGNLELIYDYNTASKTITDLYTSLTLDGYEFGGWYNANGSNPGEVSGSKCTVTDNITGNKTYYAKWTKLYSITLSENSTTKELDPQTSTSYTLPTELSVGTCDNDENELVGWSTVTIPTPGDKPTTNFYDLGETVTLTADQTTFYAVFAKPGEGGDDIPLISFLGGVKSELLAIDGISGFGLGDDYAEGNAPYRVRLDDTGDYILYTNSSGSKITQLYIKVKMIGGGNTSKITVQTSDNNSDYADIDEWSIEGSQNNVKAVLLTVNSSSKYIRLYFDKGSNVGLGNLIFYTSSTSYSDYTTTCLSKHSITYDFNDGEGNCDNEKVTHGEGYTICDEEPTKAGYTFLHWANGENTYAPGTTIENVQADITLTATWQEREKYTLTFNDQGDTKEFQYIESLPVEMQESWADICSGPIQYVFDGWAKAPVNNGTTEYEKVDFSTFTMPAENTTLYAVYRYAEEGSGDDDYHLVEEELTDYSGDYLIVSYDNNYAMSTSAEDEIGTNTYAAYVDISEYYADKIIKSNSTTDTYVFTATKTTNGYSLCCKQNNTYLAILNTSTGTGSVLRYYEESDYNTNLSECEWSIGVGSISNYAHSSYNQYIRWNNNPMRFAIYTPSSVKGIHLYKKGIGASYIYTSSLICGAITAEDAWVTSTKEQTVKVKVPITLESSTGATTINATSDNAAFDVTGLTDVEAGDHTIVVEYTPAEYNITETANITLSATNGATTTFTVSGRSLPEKFAIVAEKDGKFYALPADMPNAGAYAGYEVEVKDNTVVTAPATYVYSLSAVHNTRYADNGTAVRFVGNDNKCLWASVSKNAPTSIRNFAGIENAQSDQYEWTLNTQDGKSYTITSSTTTGRQLRMYGANLGLYASGANTFRFLPIQTKTYTTTALSSKFSVAKDKKVQFSAGNLQYHTGDNAWRFAEQQYQYMGDNNKNISTPDFNDWIDMFGWSADGKYGVNTSINNDDYQGEFVDWGTLFPDEWYTLSKNEWIYLLHSRANASQLKQLAKVGDVYGVLLFPDEWVMPNDITPSMEDTYSTYTLDQWEQLESVGAVFLPAAGRRIGNDQVNTNHYTYYWTSTKEAENKVYYLINCNALGNDQYEYALPQLWYEKGLYGQSVRLVRECIEPEKPQALPSTFSVSATEKVQFSAGNLQYHTGEQIWRFAPEQYDIVGQPNTNIGNPNFKDWVDMFGWSADGKFGVNPSNNQSDYNGEFVDWGKVFSDAKYGISADEWYTLSMNEWYYLLYTRTNASSLKQVATVGDMIGVLLFPDEWVMLKGIEVTKQTDADGVEYYPYTIDQWKQLEAAGAVFLPAAGRRTGGWGNRTVSPHIEDKDNQDNFDSEGYYRWQDNTNYYGYYWTSTKADSDGRSYFLITCKIGADGETGNPSLPSLWDEQGRYGQSVRLVRKLMPLQVVEWKENSVVVMYNGDPAQTATVTINNVQKGSAMLSDPEVEKDKAVYELPATDLASSPNQPLEIAIGTAKVTMTIPYIATTTTTNVVPNNSDLVVLKDATFTATNEQLLRNVTVYGGGTLVVGEGATLSTNSLTLRTGGVTDGNYDYVYPQFLLKGAWSNTSGKINLDYLTTKEQYYTFVAPFAVQTKDIHYPVDIYGNNVAADNTGSFEFQYYDGEARATGATGWKTVEECTNGATLNPGQGYTFLGMPKKINGTRQKYGIHRIPMSVSAADAMSHEKTDQTITVAPHPSEKNNNSGWNLIGNPYMSTIGGLTNEDIQVGKLVHTNDANGNWTGGWHWDEQTVREGQRFLVIPSNDGQSYEAVQASNATLPAFKNFFVQIGKENANALSIPRTKPSAQLLAPARRTEEVVKDVEVAIVLEQDEAHTDQMDFLINNIYTEDFERDADFTKMMNATNLNLYGVHPYDNLSFVAIDNNTARGSVAIGYQVPQAGEYTLRMSDKPYIMWDKIEALYVTDHEMSPEIITDIMSEPYRFTVANAETNYTRFTVSVILKVEEDDGGGDVGTGVDNTTNNNTPCKFIYQDKMYILLNGVIYDAMGKQVQTINK